jgi:hypothetical protein
VRKSLKFLVFLGIACSAFAQQPAAPGDAGAAAGGRGQGGGGGRGAGGGRGGGGGRGPAAARPVLVIKEDWKQTAAGGEHGFSPEDISNPNLDVKIYGAKPEELLVTGTARDGDPIHLWTGTTPGGCAVTLRDKVNFVDLTGLARIRWVSKVSGFHQVRPVVKLADGTLLVGDHVDEARADYRVSELNISEVRWIRLDPDKVQTKGDFVAAPDLSKVDEIGFVDLMAGSGHGAGGWVDVGSIEVYGKAVPRS